MMEYDMLASIAPINPQAFGPIMQQGQPRQGGMPPQGGEGQDDMMIQYVLDKIKEIRGGESQRGGALSGVIASMAKGKGV